MPLVETEQAIARFAYAAVEEAAAPAQDVAMLATFATQDPVLDAIPQTWIFFPGFLRHQTFVELAEALREEPIWSEDSQGVGPAPGSGKNAAESSLGNAASALFDSALKLCYFRRTSPTADNLIMTMRECLSERVSSVAGGPVTHYRIHGLLGVRLGDNEAITTPWGVVTSVPTIPPHIEQRQLAGFRAPGTTALFVQTHVRAGGSKPSRAGSSGLDPEVQSQLDREMRAAQLLPLAFALGTNERNRCAPTFKYSVSLVPGASGFGVGWTQSHQPADVKDLEAQDLLDISRWATQLEARHVQQLDIAARKIVSAIAHRWDPGDSLLDAVTAWENMVGTSSETSFRVTASLSKLIEADFEARDRLYRALKRVYTTRSKVVHGESVDASVLAEHSRVAIDVAIRSLRELYSRGGDWLATSSLARADRLLLT